MPRFLKPRCGDCRHQQHCGVLLFLITELRRALFRHLCVYFIKIDDFMRRRAGIIVIAV
jgi:hypothetical protein